MGSIPIISTKFIKENMYKPRYIQYMNLPRIPQTILDDLKIAWMEHHKNNMYNSKNYTWSDFENHELNHWCKKNISEEMYWSYQIITGDLKAHKDTVSLTKINYVADVGNENVKTIFWNDEHTEILDEYIIEPHRWHILKADTLHSVEGVEPGRIRWGIFGNIFIRA